MKTMMLTGIRKMAVQETPDPEITDGSGVLIKMMVTGVCGSDIHYYQNGRIGSQIIDYPFPVGHEGAGIVVAVGKDVISVKPGDRIAIEPAMPCHECDQCLSGREHTCRKLKFLGCPGQADGCLSEYIVMPESSCFRVPDAMSFEEAAISEPLAIGVYAVRKAGLIKNARIGILGFGPIGMSVMLSALAEGAEKIYVTDKIDERVAKALQTGATWAGNPDKEDIASMIDEREHGGLDVVFECCGKQEAIDQAGLILKPGGKIMIIGIPEFDNWSFNADIMRRKELSLINVRRQNNALDETLGLLSSGKVDVTTMVTHRFSFEQTKEAFDLVADYKDGVMKAMVHFDTV
ncbi:MAG: alcohol dehydrogenase catalytic domain-containing protein [Bacteroidales bacterium]